MRPIDKGSVPTDEHGDPKTFSDYRKWRLDLINRIGNYCAYCNMPLYHSLNVEHVVPKKPQKGQPKGDPLAWENLLLACGPCNFAKGNKPVHDVFLPEKDNALLYLKTGFKDSKHLLIYPAKNLSPNLLQKAENTIALFRWQDANSRNDIVDLRSLERSKARSIAELALRKYIQINEEDKPYAVELIAQLAAAKGFFIVWFEVFEEVTEVLKALVQAVPGTDLKV